MYRHQLGIFSEAVEVFIATFFGPDERVDSSKLELADRGRLDLAAFGELFLEVEKNSDSTA
jgi:hypothetical protein